MKNLIKKTALILLASATVSVAPVMAEEISSYKLEKALMKYVLTYEAYQKAKQSSNKEVRANLPKYVRLYREAYAQYLQLLREAELYDPSNEKMENDPAGNYNRKVPEKQQIEWTAVNSGSQRAQVKKVVENGGNPDDVFVVVKNNLPEKSYHKTREEKEKEAEEERRKKEEAANNAEQNNCSGTTTEDNGLNQGSGSNNSSGKKDSDSSWFNNVSNQIKTAIKQNQ